MKQLKFYFAAGLSFLLCTGLAHAQAMKDGQIKVFQKTGDVQLLKSDGSKSELNKGDVFTDGSIVIAGPDGHALLVFSNGTTLKVDPNGQLEIKTFKQAPFDEKAAGGTYIALVQDPSQSVTDLNLINGTLQGEVKHLDESAGSKFTVDTPAGSAGIRGTVISLSVTRDPTTGAVISITANCFVGAMTFTPHGGKARNVPNSPPAGVGAPVTGTGAGTGVSVPAGAQIQVTLTVNPTTGAISGVSLGGASLSTATSGQALAAIFQTINAARTDPAINPTPLPPAVVPAAPPPTTVAPAPPPVVTTTTNAATGAVTQTVVGSDNTVTTTTTSATGVETTTVVGPSDTVVATAVTTPATATTPATTVSTVVAPDNTIVTTTASTNAATGQTTVTTQQTTSSGAPVAPPTVQVVPSTSVTPAVLTAQNQATAGIAIPPIQVAPAPVAPPATPQPAPPPPVVTIPVTPAPPTPPPTTNTPPVNTNPTLPSQ